MKAFAILGILANSGGLAVISALAFKLAKLPAVVAAGLYGFAAFSYIIVWALDAAENGRPLGDACGGFASAQAGTTAGIASNVNLGASFGLLIVAWLLCVVAALGALFMASKGEGSGVLPS